ncbi:hypothetical protein CALVIDRAFT_583858 [Calocera viscosa TUFC12733]|uniref:F-box domain-containing protein n=1 Tax=Calocera viscosa (strain TUFC12733) TaxID=1330018 RepID=A0A167QXV4_CALVF|nr:hypothetical protein CALVIDRAFT_583858 [Calocera viscosa TUFC12733]
MRAIYCLIRALRVGEYQQSASERVGRYAFCERYIQQLTLNAADDALFESLNEFILMHTLRTSTMGPALPKLITLIFTSPGDNEEWVLFTGAAYCIASLCLSPTVRELHYSIETNDPDILENEATSFFQAVSAICTGLSSLHISIESADGAADRFDMSQSFSMSISKTVAALPALFSFSFPEWAISDSLLSFLSVHKTLSQLTVTNDEYQYCAPDVGPRSTQSPPTGWFLSLRELSISAHIETLKTFLPQPEWGAATGLPMDQMPMLEYLTLESDSEEYDEPWFSMTSSFHLLRTCRRITHLDLSINFRPPMSDAEIEVLASTWPRLQSLSFGIPDYRLGGFETNMTSTSLLHLATHCHSLTYLNTRLSNLEDLTIPTAFVSSPALITLELHSQKGFARVPVEAYLQRLWPTARLHLT